MKLNVGVQVFCSLASVLRRGISLWHDEDAVDILLPAQERVGCHQRGCLVTVVIVLVIVLVAGGSLYWGLNSRAGVQYTVTAVDTGPISMKIDVPGSVHANATYRMNFTMSGQVSEIRVQVGQQVKRGQVLARLKINKTSLQNAIDVEQVSVSAAQEALGVARANVQSAQSNLGMTQGQVEATLQVAANQQQSDLAACQRSGNAPDCVQIAGDRFNQVQAQGNASIAAAQKQVSEAQLQAANAQGALEMAQARLRAAQQNLKSAQDGAVLMAPVDTLVAAINGAVGQYVSSAEGNVVGVPPFIVLVDCRVLKMSVELAEADIGNIQVGLPAQFRVRSYPATVFAASVSAIEMIGKEGAKGARYTVTLTIDRGSMQGITLYPGMSAHVTIRTIEHVNALLVPVAALNYVDIAVGSGEIERTMINALRARQRTMEEEGRAGSGRIVLVQRGDRLVPVPILVGFTNDEYLEVLSGLRLGDRVVVGRTDMVSTSSR
jgi:HlyD family secretion protein